MLRLGEHVRFWLVPPEPWFAKRSRRPMQILQVGDMKVRVGRIGGFLIMLALIKPGMKISAEEIVRAVWPEPEDEPQNPYKVIHVQVFDIKRALLKHGLYLDVVGHKRSGGWRINGLMELEDGAGKVRQ